METAEYKRKALIAAKAEWEAKQKRLESRNRSLAKAQAKAALSPVSKAASLMGKRRLRQLGGKEQMRQLAATGGLSSWSKFSKEERHLEMKRRAAVRKRNQQARLAEKIEEMRKG